MELPDTAAVGNISPEYGEFQMLALNQAAFTSSTPTLTLLLQIAPRKIISSKPNLSIVSSLTSKAQLQHINEALKTISTNLAHGF